jgi:hypothetical protein
MKVKAAARIVLVSRGGYAPRYDTMLRRLILRPIRLFCALGKDCRKWESAVQRLSLQMEREDSLDHFVITTLHPEQTAGEVIRYAGEVDIQGCPPEVEVIEI